MSVLATAISAVLIIAAVIFTLTTLPRFIGWLVFRMSKAFIRR